MRHLLLVCTGPLLIGLAIGLVVGPVRPAAQPSAIESTEADAIPGTLTVCFALHSNNTLAAIRAIGTAKKSIHVLASDFTSTAIAQALCTAVRRGVRVEVLADQSAPLGQDAVLRQLVMGEAHVHTDHANRIVHNQVMVIDENTVLTGKFNWSPMADTGNADSLLVIDSPGVAAVYLKKWHESRQHSKPFPGGRNKVP